MATQGRLQLCADQGSQGPWEGCISAILGELLLPLSLCSAVLHRALLLTAPPLSPHCYPVRAGT